MVEHPVIARVLPDSRVPQLSRAFDYRVPPGMQVTRGIQVKVPLGRGGRTVTGIVVDLVDHSDFSGELADIDQVLSEVVVAPDELLKLAEEVAARQAGGISDVLRLAIPSRAVRVEKRWQERDAASRDLPEPPPASEWFAADVFETLATPEAKHWWQLPYGVSTSPDGTVVPRAYLEVARLAAHTLNNGHSAIIVAADWRDVALLSQALHAFVGEEFIVALGPENTGSERYQSYLRCLESDPVVVVGARHAVYTPVSKLGLVLVLEDGDESHREPLAPYPHTRDVALIRAEQSRCGLVFAGVSPSIHVHRLRQMGFLRDAYPTRANRPRVIPTALTRTDSHGSSSARLPSMAYQQAKKALESGPVLVQVFRSGFAPGLACDRCGERARCDRCQGPLRRHHAGGLVSCGWCGQPNGNWTCPECGSTGHRPLGQAVGRTVTELGRAFPGVKVIQADGDHRFLTLPRQKTLVVATRGAEPVVPGGYAVVLLLDGHAMLQRESLGALTDTLMAWEHALALLSDDGVAYLTDLDGPVAQAFGSGAVEALLGREYAERQQLGLPPAVRLAVIEGQPAVVDETLAGLARVVGPLEQLGPISRGPGAVRVVLKVPYARARDVARELRAEVVRRSVSGRSRGPTLKVSMDGQHALDELTAQSQ